MSRTRCYTNGILTDEGFPLDQVSEHLEETGSLVWVDLLSPDVADLTLMAHELGIHALAVEDALHPRQRPKLDMYGDHSFLSAYAVRLGPEGSRVETSEVAAFITPRALVTVRKSEAFDIDAVVQRWDNRPELAKEGVASLLHGLLDYIVDSHFETVELLDDRIEHLAELMFEQASDQVAVQRQSFELRKSLVEFRRVVLPMREVVNSLIRRDLHIVSDTSAPYFQDVYDHVLRATEWTESLRDLISSVLETNLTIQGNRLNIITKQVTSWAAIIAVPTMITGFYGQNLPFPGYLSHAGFLTSAILIVGLSAILYLIFKRKDWL